MVRHEIESFIKQNRGMYSDESIKKQLINAGWKQTDIDDAFSSLDRVGVPDMSTSVPQQEPTVSSQTVPSGDVRYVGFWARFAAYFIDSIIIFILSIVLAIVLFVLIGLIHVRC